MVNTQKLDVFAAKAGLNDYQIAEALGIAPSTYSRKKNGNRIFKPMEIGKLVKLLKIPYREIRTTFLD